MKLHRPLLRKLADWGLIEEKVEYFNAQEREYFNWRKEESRKLEVGEEINPPWGNGKTYDPTWSGTWRQGRGEVWLRDYWYPFWENLNAEQKQAYFEKYQVPPEDWYQILVLRQSNLSQHTAEWLSEQKEKINLGEEIKPPYITFPISLPDIGWDDYSLEKWKLEIWIPFWEKLSGSEREEYLKKWKPPNQKWEENLTRHWIGNIKKSETWLERQKFFLENQDEHNIPSILMPWQTFPNFPAKETAWDIEFLEAWKNKIWLPYSKNIKRENLEGEIKGNNPPENWQNYLGVNWAANKNP